MFAVTKYRHVRHVLQLLALGVLTLANAMAEDEPRDVYSAPELAELVGPVALYPDDLIAIVLPASSYPLQIVEAARYLEAYQSNPELQPDDDWDDAVVALLNYPEVVELMNDDLDWTWNLGEAVVNQQADVLDAIQVFRGRAVAAGNLKTDDRQKVSQAGEVIEVTPIDQEVIYVPYYEPSRVVVYQSRPVYHYYPRAYPVYYYPYPSHYSFSSGFFWGVTTAYTVGWLTDRVHFHYYGHASHPYFGRHYASHYRARHAVRIRHRHNPKARVGSASNRQRYGNTWRAGRRHGDRPRRAVAERRRTDATNFRSSAGRRGWSADARTRSGARQQRSSWRPSDARRDAAPPRRARDAGATPGGRRNMAMRNNRTNAGRADPVAGRRTGDRASAVRSQMRNAQRPASARLSPSAPRAGKRANSTRQRSEPRVRASRNDRPARSAASTPTRSAPQPRSNARRAGPAPAPRANAARNGRSAGPGRQSQSGRSAGRGKSRR